MLVPVLSPAAQVAQGLRLLLTIGAPRAPQAHCQLTVLHFLYRAPVLWVALVAPSFPLAASSLLCHSQSQSLSRRMRAGSCSKGKGELAMATQAALLSTAAVQLQTHQGQSLLPLLQLVGALTSPPQRHCPLPPHRDDPFRC